jgi:hypothetical protein
MGVAVGQRRRPAPRLRGASPPVRESERQGVSATDKIAYAAVGALVLTVNWNGIPLFGTPVADTVLVIAAAAVGFLVITERRSIPLSPWMFLAGTGLLFAALLNMTFPPDSHVLALERIQATRPWTELPPSDLVVARSDLAALLKFELMLLVIPVILAITATTTQRCARLLDVWALATIISAAVAVVDFAGVAHLAANHVLEGRSSGLAIHPNYCAMSCVLGLPPALLWLGRSPRWTLAGLLGVTLLLAGVYASGSRAAAAVALPVLAATVLAVPRLRRSAGVALPLAGMALILLFVFTDTGNEIVHQVRLGAGAETFGSDVERVAFRRVAEAQFESRPVQGVGFAVISDAHNIYVQLLAAGGLIALVSFALYLTGLMSFARRALRGEQREEATVAIVAILAWLVSGPFTNMVADKFLYVLPGLLFAMSLVASVPVRTTRSRAGAPTRGRYSRRSAGVVIPEVGLRSRWAPGQLAGRDAPPPR